ncbi:DUF1801 domain-containing protein [Paracoccus luteus]|uniref:DUF1801 domain-containing protein n=1 Tax=Paracoccus luteus TaxID=2508543 RepID=UPI00106F4103|nr:DUF1801 domain-containing protein [Paracoccus luteus]
MPEDANDDTPRPRLLAGGNPQIPKGYGDAPVAAWLDAAPGWKQDAARELDRLIVAAVPGVAKAVKWNSPLYGPGDGGWFLGLHCLTRYIKVAFFRGAQLDPPPPEPSRQDEVRYWHLHEGETVDAARFTDWVRQASRLPGVKM